MTVTANLYCNLSAWASGTKTAGNCVSASGNAYRCITGGTSATTPSGTSTTPVSFGSDTSTWVWLSAITFSGATADAMFTAAVSGAVASGGLTGTITQPIIWQLWNVNFVTMNTSAAGTSFLTLTGHSFTTTNTLTITPAPGESFRNQGSSTVLAFNATNGVSFTLPATTGSQNYFNITDPNVIINGIQFKDPDSTSGSTIINLNTGANNFALRNCIVDGYSQTGGADMFGISSTAVTGMLFTNCLFIDRQAASANIPTIKDSGSSTTTGKVINCTFIGINAQTIAPVTINSTATSSWVLKNTVSIGFSAGVFAEVGSATALNYDHNGTDATKIANQGTDGGSELLSQTVANMFVSSTTDFRLKSGSPFINAGVADTTDIPTADDIYGTSRPQGTAWCMGCYEFPVASTVYLYPIEFKMLSSYPVINKTRHHNDVE